MAARSPGQVPRPGCPAFCGPGVCTHDPMYQNTARSNLLGKIACNEGNRQLHGENTIVCGHFTQPTTIYCKLRNETESQATANHELDTEYAHHIEPDSGILDFASSKLEQANNLIDLHRQSFRTQFSSTNKFDGEDLDGHQQNVSRGTESQATTTIARLAYSFRYPTSDFFLL